MITRPKLELTEYSIVKPEKRERQTALPIKKLADQLLPAIDNAEEITRKTPPYEMIKKSEKEATEYEPLRLIIFKCKAEYNEFYPIGVHGAIIKAETEEIWFGIPIKEPYFGIIEWSKRVWDKVYDAKITHELFCQDFSAK